jgi:hypothetical protein
MLTMKERTAAHFLQLQNICNAPKNKRPLLLEETSNCLINYLTICCKGVLMKHITFPILLYKKLGKFRKDLLLFANNKTSLRTKRAALIEKNGGFLSFILPALASIVHETFGELISKKFIK